MKKRVICYLVISFLCGNVLAAHQKFTVCNAHNNQRNPAISDHVVVWEDLRSGVYNIHFRFLEDENDYPVCPSSSAQSTPDIDGKIVVWAENGDIIGYDLVNDIRMEICVDDNVKSSPKISGDIVVWQENYAIFYCNIKELQKIRVCDNGKYQLRPDVDGDIIVWLETTYDIVGKNISTGQVYDICSTDDEQLDPKISENLVVWVDSRNSETGYDIYGKYIGDDHDFVICQAPEDQIAPFANGNLVVWSDERLDPSQRQIYLKDISTGAELALTANSDNLKNPRINNYTVIWENLTVKDIEGAYLSFATSIDIEAPQAGEMIPAGTVGRIVWNSSPIGAGVIKIEFSPDGGTTYEELVTAQNTGYYDLEIPGDVNSDQCFIKISDAGNPNIYALTGPFTIAPCSDKLTADIDNNCEVDLRDLAILISQWLKCGNPYDQNCIN